MAVVNSGGLQVPVHYAETDAQSGTGSLAVVTGSEIDARAWRSLAYTAVVATAAMDWNVYGANASDYSDEVAVDTNTNVAAGNDSYVIDFAPFNFYRVKAKNNGGSTGTIKIRGACKR